MGYGEVDELVSLGVLFIAAKKKLENPFLLINCILERLDGPVRGNSSIIKENGSGTSLVPDWNVIRAPWGAKLESAPKPRHARFVVLTHGGVCPTVISGVQGKGRRLHREHSSANIKN